MYTGNLKVHLASFGSIIYRINPWTAVLSAFVGSFWTLSFTSHFGVEELPSGIQRSILFFLFYVVYFSMLAYVLLGRAIRRLKGFKTGEWMRWIAGAALTGMLVTIVIQPAPSPVPVWSEVTITPLNQRDPKAQGSQVRLIRVVNHDRRLPLSLFERDGDWQLLDDGVVMLAPTGASGSLRWSGWVRGALRVMFIQNPWSGMVRVTLNGQTQVVNLYSDQSSVRVVTLTPDLGMPAWAPGAFFGLVDWVSLSLLALMVSLLVAEWPSKLSSGVCCRDSPDTPTTTTRTRLLAGLLLKVLVSVIIGSSLTASFIAHIAAAHLVDSVPSIVFIVLYCVVCFSALAYLLLGYTMRCFRALSRRDQRVCIACSVLAGMIAMVVMPPVPLPLWVWSEVTITSLNQRDPEWQGSEVWLLRAFNGGRRLSLTEFEDDGTWVMGNNGELIAPGVYGTLRWRGWVHRALDLEFLRHPWSGRVRVTINGRTYDIVNSYSKPLVWPDAWRETLTPVSNVSSRSHEAFLFRVADWIGSSAVVLAGAVVFTARRVRR